MRLARRAAFTNSNRASANQVEGVAPVTLAEPASFEGGPAAQVARGMDVAAAEVHETDAAIVWPARYVWISPETITSLIEAHGVTTNRSLVLRPAFDGSA